MQSRRLLEAAGIISMVAHEVKEAKAEGQFEYKFKDMQRQNLNKTFEHSNELGS